MRQRPEAAAPQSASPPAGRSEGYRGPAEEPFATVPPQGTAPGAGPRVRGGHPVHPEPARPSYAGPQRRGAVPPGAAGAAQGRRFAGPRQDYLDAFDGPLATDTPPGGTGAVDDVFAAGVPGPRGPYPAPATARVPAPRSPAPPAPAEAHDTEEPEVEEDAFAAGRRGRTVTGIAAAAITTVLTVLVAGQVATAEKDDSRGAVAGGGERTDEDSASRSEGRPTPSDEPSGVPVPVTYEQQMAEVYPLDPKLDGPGTFTAVSGNDKAPASGDRKWTYRVDVEKELGLDGKLFARAVQTTLNDERSWAHDGRRSFERVSTGKPDFVITLASPGTTAEWCAKSGLDTTEDNVSCDSAATERIMINAYRWARGSKTFGDDRIFAYRQMLINHEVGHRLGFDHVYCDEDGAPAPVMMQQTKSLTTEGRTCKPNPWLYPEA